MRGHGLAQGGLDTSLLGGVQHVWTECKALAARSWWEGWLRVRQGEKTARPEPSWKGAVTPGGVESEGNYEPPLSSFFPLSLGGGGACGVHPQHMQFPRLGVKSEPQLLAYTTATP